MSKIARTAGLAAVGAALVLGVVVGLDSGTADAAPSPEVLSATAGGMYGNPAAAAPYWRQQFLDDCAHVNDSGNEHGQDETVDIGLLAKSWATSGDHMIVTGETG